MESGRRDSSEDYIDPHLLQLQESLGSTGTWMPDFNYGATSSARNTLLDIVDLDDIADVVRSWDLSLATELPVTNSLVAPAEYASPAAPSLVQPATAPGSGLRPQAEVFRPQRPQLQLATSQTHLQPNNPAYTQPAPQSAPTPDIRVDGPESLPQVHYPASALPAHGNSRRRAVSYEPPALHHLETAPAALAPRSNGLLSPMEAQRARCDDPFVSEDDIRGAFAASSPQSPERSRQSSRSPSGSRSHSRSSSVASSVRSSVNGDYRCGHDGCGRTFSHPAKLNHHKRYHTPMHLRPFACDQCKARFLFKRELDRHKLSKTHQAPQFVCSGCSHRFGRQDHLDRHVERNSCPQRPTTPATPASSDMLHSAPSTTGSSIENHTQSYGSASHLRFDTPFTQPETPLYLDSGAFPPLPPRSAGSSTYDCTASMVMSQSEQWPPSPSPASYYYGNRNDYFPGNQQ